MNKSLVWSERAKKDLSLIASFYDNRNGSSIYNLSSINNQEKFIGKS